MGDVLDRIALSSSNIDASVVKVKKSIDLAKGSNVAFGSVRKEPFVIARLGTKIAEVVDPTGCEGYPGTGNLERVCVCLCFFVQL